jgi:hypothetical protein
LELSFEAQSNFQLFLKLGTKLLLGQIIYQSSVLFIIPYLLEGQGQGPAGIFPILLSTNKLDFIDTGYTFTYEDSVPNTVFESFSTPTPVIFFLVPSSVKAGISSKVKIVGDNFQQTASCYLGVDSAPLYTQFVSKTEVRFFRHIPYSPFFLTIAQTRTVTITLSSCLILILSLLPQPSF